MLRTDGATAAVGYSSALPWPPDSHGQLENDALPPGWKVSKDHNGIQYYYNRELKVTQWNRPETAHQSRQIPQGAVSPPMSPPPPHNGRYSEGTPSVASRSHSKKRYITFASVCFDVAMSSLIQSSHLLTSLQSGFTCRCLAELPILVLLAACRLLLLLLLRR